MGRIPSDGSGRRSLPEAFHCMDPATPSSPLAELRSGKLLAGRVAVISGAGRERGIGKATAALFAEHGARVVLLDLNADDAIGAAADVWVPGSATLGLACDVRREEDCAAAIARVLAWEPAQGRIDIVVNNAGLTQRLGIEDIGRSDLDRINDVVLRGSLQLTQAALPTMRRQARGSVVMVSSMSAQQGGGVFGGAHYCAAKAAVLGLTRALARELGPAGIRANAVAPGLTLTDFSGTGRTDADKHASAAQWPMARAARPVEIAGACLFLSSDLASYVTWATLDVNGGAYMR
jgi:NAD(P)-dependent dehydrogenase (short-subunit alcohol dehydrogenase family)